MLEHPRGPTSGLLAVHLLLALAVSRPKPIPYCRAVRIFGLAPSRPDKARSPPYHYWNDGLHRNVSSDAWFDDSARKQMHDFRAEHALLRRLAQRSQLSSLTASTEVLTITADAYQTDCEARRPARVQRRWREKAGVEGDGVWGGV